MLTAKDINNIRRQTGLSVTEFATLIGSSYMTVYRWEDRKTSTCPRGFAATIIRLTDLAMKKDKKLSEVIQNNIITRGPMYTLYRILEVIYNKDPKPFSGE